MSNVINLADVKKMQKALDEADIPHDDPDLPRMIAYRDIHDMPQLVTEGQFLSQQQLDNMPLEIQDMLQILDEGEADGK